MGSSFFLPKKGVTMNRYFYNGPVMAFDKCVANSWSAETVAVSEKKARSNLVWQYKKIANCGGKITLPGKLQKEDI